MYEEVGEGEEGVGRLRRVEGMSCGGSGGFGSTGDDRACVGACQTAPRWWFGARKRDRDGELWDR